MNENEAIRNQYAHMGVEAYYQAYGAGYRNPHEPIVAAMLRQWLPAWHLDLSHVLDLACGSGEVTLVCQALGANQITGVDPYTAQAYHARTGLVALPHTFAAIADGVLLDQTFSVIVCSFALHLVEPSRLPGLCIQLSQLSPTLVIVTPHKRPAIESAWGWQLHAEVLQDRVRMRLYDAR